MVNNLKKWVEYSGQITICMLGVLAIIYVTFNAIMTLIDIYNDNNMEGFICSLIVGVIVWLITIFGIYAIIKIYLSIIKIY